MQPNRDSRTTIDLRLLVGLQLKGSATGQDQGPIDSHHLSMVKILRGKVKTKLWAALHRGKVCASRLAALVLILSVPIFPI